MNRNRAPNQVSATSPSAQGRTRDSEEASAARLKRLARYSSVGALNWLQGRHLIPTLAAVGASVNGTVVDVGCGHSPFRDLFHRAREYVRIDCYPVDEGVIVADATSLPLADSSVDCVILSQVLGDVADIVALFVELRRVLSSEGRIIVYETVAYLQHDLPHDFWRVLPAGLQWAASEAGLDISELKYLGGYGTQLAMHWNHIVSGIFDRAAVTRPIAWPLRAAGNLAFAGLDSLVPRPLLATDYFACLVLPQVAKSETASPFPLRT